MPRWPLLQPPTCVRGGWSSNISRLTIEGRTLDDVQLGGWVYGPELGTAPAVLIVGGITASPFPFGDGQSEGDDPRAAWWPALVRARPDRSREVHGAVPVVAGQRLDVEGFRRSELARIHFGRGPRRSGRGVARWLRLQDPGDVGRRQPRRHGRRGVRGASSPSAARSSSRSPPACGPTAGARRRVTCSASWCATVFATATSRPA